MKRFSIFAAAAAALMLASCAESGINETTTEAQQSKSQPVEFGTYLGLQTRAGAYGNITNTDSLKADSVHFGVFAYYSDKSDYAQTLEPNFMYNQLVTDDGDNWVYSPLKYWPNEAGNPNVDQQSDPATSTDGADKLTFFAYAPYVYVTPSSGKIDATNTNIKYYDTSDSIGITGMTSNATAGDPKIYYTVAENPYQATDLLWAVVQGDDGTTNWTTAAKETIELTNGLPWLNLAKPNVKDKVKFYFRHALAKVVVKVVAAVDEVDPGENVVDDSTVVTVDSVAIKNFGGGKKGTLNLNNTTANKPLWLDVSSDEDFYIVAGLSKKQINDSIADSGADENQWPLINAEETGLGGVTNTDKYLLKNDANNGYIPGWMVIPTDSWKDMDFYISYYVNTKDAALKNGYSRIHNQIARTITASTLKETFGDGMSAGKVYTLRIILGLTSVKFEAAVADWDSNTTAQPVYLPMNVKGE